MNTKLIPLFILFAICCFKATAQQEDNSMGVYGTVVEGYQWQSSYIRGSPLLLREWARGLIVNHSDSIINDSALLMNYDKLRSTLVVTRDMQTFLYPYRDDVKAFKLFAPNADFAFYWVPEISNHCFFQLIATGDACTVYKKIITSIKRRDYNLNGAPDYVVRNLQYVDAETYYIMNISGKSKFSGKFYLNKGSIKRAFSFNPEKCDQYFAQHSDEHITDDFVKGIADYFNQ